MDQLDLDTAIDEEAQSWRNQVPPEPWTQAIASNKSSVEAWIRTRLATGLVATPNVAVNVRKSSLGTRPVPIMGILERVVYRALTSYVIGPALVPDRSAEAYREFLYGPISHAFTNAQTWWPSQVSLKYIVEADIAAFYQYVDHDVLRLELELQTGKVEGIDFLMELLAETQQRSFGIPQFIDTSDWLSEIYIRIVERELVRYGWPVWRYNDDFRIGCRDYTEALNAIERLDESARSIGLTVSDYKTRTPSFTTYFLRNTGLNISDTTIGIDPTDVDVIIVDYEALSEDQIEAAIATLRRTHGESTDDDPINLKRVTRAQVRDLRRAISSLTSHKDASGLDFVMDLLVFIPSLTPRVCDYLIAIGSDEHQQQVAQIFDDVLANISLGEWQALWFTYVCRKLRLLGKQSRLRWLAGQRDRGRGRPLGAEAALALAEAGVADFDDLNRALRSEPEALAPWYLLGMKSMAIADLVNYGNRARAVRDSSRFNRILLDM
ncbi:MAG: reverse transcriptase domain-containing protein [bacterium]|nr:reverse transcriptase domain-containing protein [bacterium]